MAESIGGRPPETHAAPLRGVGEGVARTPTPATHAATVVAVVGSEGGAVLHEVRLLGRIVPLLAPAEIPVGTLVEVIASRTEGALVATLPGETLPAGIPSLRTSISPESAPRADLTSTAGAGRPPAAEGSAARVVVPSDFPADLAARLRAEGLETNAGIRAAKNLVARGVPPTGALLRGGAIAEGALSTGEATPARSISALTSDLAGALRAAAAPSEGAPTLPAALRSELAPFASLFSDARLTPREQQVAVEWLTRTITRAVEAALARDPRLMAAREAGVELLRDLTPPVPPSRSEPSPAPSLTEAALARGLTAAAKKRGLALLGQLEQKAIEEHLAHREWRPVLRELLDRANVLSYRLSLEIAERDGGFRSDPQNTWFVETPAGRPIRVRREVRRGGGEESTSTDDEQTFRIETHGGTLGEVVVAGARRSHEGETFVGLELSAEEERTHTALGTHLDRLIESFDDSEVRVSTTVVPWRVPREETANVPVELPRSRLDRKV